MKRTYLNGGTVYRIVGDPDPKTTFTKDEVDAMLKEEQAKAQAKVKQLEDSVKKMEDGTKGKRELEEQLKLIQGQQSSEMTVLRQENEKLKEETTKERDKLVAERDAARKEADNMLVTTEFQRAGAAAGVYREDQILDMYQHRAEVLVVDGKRGVYVEHKTKDGKPVKLQPTQLLAELKGDPSYANLFKGNLKEGGGIGDIPGQRVKGPDIKKDPAAYRESYLAKQKKMKP